MAQEVRIVGIGASAGGLEALRELMESLPDSDVFCFVIAQHVSPTHISMLMNLLAPLTQLMVQDLHDQQVPKAGVVYITPPSHNVILREGLLCLTEPQQAVGPKPSINHFFYSLADELGERAIGVILSGTGSDGAAGIRAIKAAGGVTIAQEPDTAKYDGMPKAAIHTGSIDLILSPLNIGKALERLLSLPHDLSFALNENESIDEYALISNIVRINAAFKLNDYKPATIKRRIARRINILGLDSLHDYIDHLKANKEESRLLMRDTFISVTSFFRDQEAFIVLERVINEIVQNRNDREVIRCWVPACASGEEVYSIAMLFEEALHNLKNPGLQYMIFASDLDEDAIEQARTALYPISELEAIPEHLRNAYMEVIGVQCRVVKSVRNRVVFARQNVIDDPPFARLDLISCRNLLIYFKPPVQKRVFEVFHYSLNPDGVLFLGRSEAVEQNNPLFKPVDNRMRIYRRLDGVSHYSFPVTQGIRLVQSKYQESRGNAANTNTDVISLRTLEELAERYAPPSLVINEQDYVIHFQGDLKPFLNFPKGRVEMYLFDLIEDDWRAEARAIVYRCRNDMKVVQGSTWQKEIDGQSYSVTFIASPLEASQNSLLLISFQSSRLEANKVNTVQIEADEKDNLILGELEQELTNTRNHLNIIVEQLETSNQELQSLNEELQSANEELQSTNEELQTSNEELQSTNEELLTVNEEMQVKSAELEKTVNDLINVKESLAFPLIVVDSQLRITQFNEACTALVAHDIQLFHTSLSSIQWLVDIPGLSRVVRRVTKEGKPFQITINHEEEIYYKLEIMPYRLARGEIAGAVLVFEDVSLQHKIELALKESHERFELAVQGSQDGIWDWKIPTNQVYWSPRFKAILGFRDDEMESSFEAWESRLHPADKEPTLAALDAHLKDNKPYNVEYRLRHKSGDYVWIQVRSHAIRDKHGNPLRMAGSITDITQRKHDELVLKEREALIRGIIDVMPEAVLMVDDNGIIKQLNSQSEIIFGYEPSELLDHSLELLVPPSSREMHKALRKDYEKHATVRPMGAGRELFALHKNGHEIPVEIALAPLIDGRKRYTVASITDITQRKAIEHALRESQKRFYKAMLYAPTGMALAGLDGRLLEVNPVLCNILGYTPEELLASDFQSIIYPDDRKTELELKNQLLSGEIETYQIDKRYFHKNGNIVWTQFNVALIQNEANDPDYFIYQIQDITKRKSVEEELSLAASVFSSTLDGVLISLPDGTILKVNSAFERITGYSAQEVIGKNTRILRSDRHDNDFYRDMWRSIEEKGAWQGEIWDRHKDGHVIPLWLGISSLNDANGRVTRFIAVMYDISEQKFSQERINYLAHYDALTGLPNRTLFTDRLNHALAKAKRNNQSLALLFIDLDNFKNVNDTFGHPIGDQLLCVVAERLRQATRAEDTIARLSGDEFTLLIENVLHESAVRATAQKILTMLVEPFNLKGNETFISASIGIALYPDDGENIDSLLKNADLAMYRSKEAGRNHYHFYTQKMSELIEERMALLIALRQAFDHDEFELHYQPIVNITTRKCVAGEALVRWNQSSKGWVSPNKFITLAEESNLIQPLGEWVFLSACRQMKEWLDSGLTIDSVSVNVSGKQIVQGNFVDFAKQVVEETNCPPQSIILELTESFIMRESEGAIASLNKLRDLGFGIAIDDFGTGYSSLSYLKRLPVTKLKLDQSFVHDIPNDSNDVAIARVILGLGKTLGLEVVAEGVETEQHHSFLLSEGCPMGQGYLYHHPISSSEFAAFVSKN